MPLSHADRQNLAALEEKHVLIRDRVRGVVGHLSTGFYLWGEGGTSKSYTVLGALQECRADYILHNSRITGRGLVDTLSQYPTSIHVLEDCEPLFNDRNALGVLRSALHSQSRKRPPERLVSWRAHRTNIEFVFTGGIIMIVNRPPEDIPEIRAIKTRITVLQLVASFDEIAALYRRVAGDGFVYGEDYLSPDECRRCAEWIIEQCRGLNRSLDMRLLINGFKDLIQVKSGLSSSTWENLMTTRMREATVPSESRSERIARERRIAREVDALNLSGQEKVQEWIRRTNHSERAYYRRLRESRNSG